MDAISDTAAGGRSVSDANTFSPPIGSERGGRVVGVVRTADSRPGAQCPLTPTTGSALRPSRYLVMRAGEPAHGRYIPERVRKCLNWVAKMLMSARELGWAFGCSPPRSTATGPGETTSTEADS